MQKGSFQGWADWYKHLRVTVLGVLLAIVSNASVAQEGQTSAAEVGKKLSDPLSDIWALFTEINYNWSEGDFSNGKWRSGQQVIFQPIMPFKLTENYKLITRPTIPIMRTDVPVGRRWNQVPIDGSTEIIFPDGSAAFDDKSGLGDMSLPILITPVPEPGQKWGFGFGPTFVFPTATEDELGHDTWDIGPAAVVTYKSGNFSGALLGQYWWDYADQGNNAADSSSHGSLLYSAWWSLPHAWQVGFNPTITYNNEAASDNKWNVPVGLGVAKTIKFGKLPVKFQLSMEKSFIRQEEFGNDWKIRLNIIPVIPSLVKNPLF